MRLAIILRTHEAPEMKPWDHHYYLCDGYKNIFDELGVTLIPYYSANCEEELCSLCDGLIVPGSNKNIYPEYYGRERDPRAHYSVDEYGKDRWIIDAFVKAGKPILGICGGEQYINVYFGGTMCQKVPGHSLGEGTHTIHIEKGSFLHKVYGSDTAEVNSYHGQCVDDVAEGFRVTARTEDGVIEAIEKDNIVGVQWHPEVAYEMGFFKEFLKTFFTRDQLKTTKIDV